MKKLILAGAAFAFMGTVLVSCGENKETKSETTTTETTTTEAAKTEQTVATTPASDAPTFASDDVNKGLAEYKSMITDYAAAIKSKDQAKITALTAKAQEVGKNMQSWMSKLKPDETQKFTEYWQKLSTEWTTAAQAAVQ